MKRNSEILDRLPLRNTVDYLVDFFNIFRSKKMSFQFKKKEKYFKSKNEPKRHLGAFIEEIWAIYVFVRSATIFKTMYQLGKRYTNEIRNFRSTYAENRSWVSEVLQKIQIEKMFRRKNLKNTYWKSKNDLKRSLRTFIKGLWAIYVLKPCTWIQNHKRKNR